MKLSDSFYEDEVREGFFVPAAVKQAWGAELTVLSEIHRICRKHHITYFAEWGTYLGAVRHGGFIPWDDDLDIGMKRGDFVRFMEVAPKEFPEGFELYHFRTHPDHTKFLANVVGKARICFEKEHLEKYHGFPFITGVDIFILDYVYRDEEKEKERVKQANFVIALADEMFEGRVSGEKAEKNLLHVESMCGVSVPRNLGKYELRTFLYGLAEDIFAQVPEEEADFCTRMMPNGLRDKNGFLLPKELLDDTVDFPFEETAIPVFSAYDLLLRKRYGDYMVLYKNAGGHNYPYFESQKKEFVKLLDFDIPGTFHPDRKHFLREEDARVTASEYKETAIRYLDRMQEILGGICTICICTSASCRSCPTAELSEKASMLQQCAIELGTYMEECKGEGYDLVAYLETICDYAYQIYEEKDVVENRKAIEQLLHLLRKEICTRRTVVFLPFKADYWDAFDPVWENMTGQEHTEVFVVPVPYYYKNYDFSLRDEQYDLSGYPEKLRVIPHDKFSLEKVCPDILFMQCPYDECNETISTSPEYYALNLRRMSKQLVYIPWFRTDEFSENDERAYLNMKHYCIMPGVVYADRVYLPAEHMCQLYIGRLTEEFGESTKQIWEHKVECLDEILTVPEQPSEISALPEQPSESPDAEAEKKDSVEQKTQKSILYGISTSSFMERGDAYLEKIKQVMQTFRDYQDKVHAAIIWETGQMEHLEQTRPQLYEKMTALLEQELPSHYVIEFDDPGNDLPPIVPLYDAYYGVAGVVAHYFRNAGKPVMIENPDVL